jgi:hypothetical protein
MPSFVRARAPCERDGGYRNHYASRRQVLEICAVTSRITLRGSELEILDIFRSAHLLDAMPSAMPTLRARCEERLRMAGVDDAETPGF